MSKEKNPVGRPRKYQTQKELEEKIQAYFAHQEKRDMPFIMPGLWAFLDICPDTATEYMSGNYDCDKHKFSETIKKAREFVANQKIERAIKGEYNATMCIFDLKNNHGYMDKVENKTDVTSGGQPISFKWDTDE